MIVVGEAAARGPAQAQKRPVHRQVRLRAVQQEVQAPLFTQQAQGGVQQLLRPREGPDQGDVVEDGAALRPANTSQLHDKGAACNERPCL